MKADGAKLGEPYQVAYTAYACDVEGCKTEHMEARTAEECHRIHSQREPIESLRERQEKQRCLIYALRMEGKTYREIGERLGSSPSSVRQRFIHHLSKQRRKMPMSVYEWRRICCHRQCWHAQGNLIYDRKECDYPDLEA